MGAPMLTRLLDSLLECLCILGLLMLAVVVTLAWGL